MSPTQISTEETEITVWGPTGSGKDWLFRGFVKELESYNMLSPGGFQFLIAETHRGTDTTLPVIAESPSDIAPTASGEDRIYSFRRIPSPHSTDGNYSTGALTHNINIHNNRGADLVAAILDPDRFEGTYLSIVRSQYLLVLLDPLFDTSRLEFYPNDIALNPIDTDINEGYPEIAWRPGLNKVEYSKILTSLLQELVDTPMPNRHLAICITKTDAIRSSFGNPWVLIERVFGQDIRKIFDRYRTDINIEAFATSAAGYIDVGGRPQPNIQDGRLIDEDRWRPVDCTAPFFWIFQSREIEHIKQNSNFLNREHNLRKYIRYPLSRPRL